MLSTPGEFLGHPPRLARDRHEPSAGQRGVALIADPLPRNLPGQEPDPLGILAADEISEAA